MRRAMGYACITEPDKAIRETDTQNCMHCNCIIHTPVNKKIEEVGDICRNCMGLICLRCIGKGCTPFLKKLEQEEARYHARRSYGI